MPFARSSSMMSFSFLVGICALVRVNMTRYGMSRRITFSSSRTRPTARAA
jgi:hypothetical protein